MSRDQIVSTCYNVRVLPGHAAMGHVAGNDVRLRDGSLWFHPYSGSKPVVIEPAKRTRPGPDKPGMDQWGVIDEVEEFA